MESPSSSISVMSTSTPSTSGAPPFSSPPLPRRRRPARRRRPRGSSSRSLTGDKERATCACARRGAPPRPPACAPEPRRGARLTAAGPAARSPAPAAARVRACAPPDEFTSSPSRRFAISGQRCTTRQYCTPPRCTRGTPVQRWPETKRRWALCEARATLVCRLRRDRRPISPSSPRLWRRANCPHCWCSRREPQLGRGERRNQIGIVDQ